MRQNTLVHVSDHSQGWRRVRSGRGFYYLNEKGQRIRNTRHLERIRALAIPPAYSDVWICPDAQGHLQATARDAKGRKQYRYHPLWEKRRQQAKFDRMLEFGRKLPAIRRLVARDLAGKRPCFKTVVAAMVRLLDCTGLRIGNEEYVTQGNSYGLSTLLTRHAQLQAHQLTISFRGKSGVQQRVSVTDRDVARIVRECHELPGQRLFQYIDDEGQTQQVRSDHVNAYIREACGADFSAKDFRTWHASSCALALILNACKSPTGEDAPSSVDAVHVIQQVAKTLGNTSAVCRKFYIHPQVLKLCDSQPPSALLGHSRKAAGLTWEEAALIELLKHPLGSKK